MIVYNSGAFRIIPERIKSVEQLLSKIPAKHCFITGSFLYKDKYADIDLFIISRSKKKFALDDKKVKITVIDFNDLHSLFYHSLVRSCISKNVLPVKDLKVTMSDYWHVINEAVPTVMNQKRNFRRDIRFLVLYTRYFETGRVMDTYELSKLVYGFKNYKKVLEYIQKKAPKLLKRMRKKSYLAKFFYSWSGGYGKISEYDSTRLLYNLCHEIIHG